MGMGARARRAAFAAAALTALFAAVALQPGMAQVGQPAAASRAHCSTAAAERAARASGFSARAERYWGNRFGEVDFSAWRAVCGHLAGRRGRDMVVVLLLEQGTGGSPKPWAVFNRTRRGRLHLSHVDLGKHLICPQSIGIHHRVLTVYRPAEYLGAYTLCEMKARYRWERGDYRLLGVHAAFSRCHDPQIYPPPGGGYGLIIEDLRVAGVSCTRGAGVAGRNVIQGAPGKWNCAEVFGGEVRCSYGRSWRRWLTYRFGGDAG
jgi:hypothetical protein